MFHNNTESKLPIFDVRSKEGSVLGGVSPVYRFEAPFFQAPLPARKSTPSVFTLFGCSEFAHIERSSMASMTTLRQNCSIHCTSIQATEHLWAMQWIGHNEAAVSLNILRNHPTIAGGSIIAGSSYPKTARALPCMRYNAIASV